MKASNTLIKKLKEFEGYRDVAYKCPAGVWTCGHGHTQGVTKGTTCTEEQAERWLREDTSRTLAARGLGTGGTLRVHHPRNRHPRQIRRGGGFRVQLRHRRI